jgi:hypothetical protein
MADRINNQKWAPLRLVGEILRNWYLLAVKTLVAMVSYLVPTDPVQTISVVLSPHQPAAELLC